MGDPTSATAGVRPVGWSGLAPTTAAASRPTRSHGGNRQTRDLAGPLAGNHYNQMIFMKKSGNLPLRRCSPSYLIPGNMPFIPLIIFCMPPLLTIFIIFCVCSN